MPNINLYDIYERKRQKFGILDSTNFQDYFVGSVNLVYSEYNEKVFEAATLEPIGSFDDIIDTRLASFTDITFDSDCDDAIQSREFWSMEWDFEKTSDTNAFSDAIVFDTVLNFTLTISDGSIVVNYGSADKIFAELPETCENFTLKFVSDCDGNRILFNGDKLPATYGNPSEGGAELTFSIGVVDSHIISGTSGLELLKTRFLTSGTLVYNFDINDDATTLVSEVSFGDIAAMTAAVTGAQWDIRYVEPSTSLDFRYRSSFEMGLDYHLQDGGQFGLEPEPERERKWYDRGIRSAREALSQQTTYKSPLNPTGA